MTNLFTKNKKSFLVSTVAVVLIGASFGLGNFLTPAAAGLLGDPCDNGNGVIQHYNKILFSSSKKLTGTTPVIQVGQPYEIIVLAPLFQVVDVRQEVVSELNFQGYKQINQNPVKKFMITIIDIEYDAECVGGIIPF